MNEIAGGCHLPAGHRAAGRSPAYLAYPIALTGCSFEARCAG